MECIIEKPDIEKLDDDENKYLFKSKETLRVATYNILTSSSHLPSKPSLDPPLSQERYQCTWEFRKNIVLEVINKLNVDVIALQEVSIEQLDYFRQNLPIFGMVGYAAYTGHSIDDIAKDENVGEILTILYNKETIECFDSKVYWLSDTPDVLSKGWDASRPRILTAAALRIKSDNVKIIVGNSHYDHQGNNALINSGTVEAIQLQKYREEQQASDIIYLGDRNCFTDGGKLGNTWYKSFIEITRAMDSRLCGNHIGLSITFIGFETDNYKTAYYPDTGKFEYKSKTIDLIFHHGKHYKITSSKNASGEYEVKEEGGAVHLLPLFGKIRNPEKRQFASDHTCLIADFEPITKPQ